MKRHVLTEKERKWIEPLLTWTINDMLRIVRSAPLMQLAITLRKVETVYDRFRRRSQEGLWGIILKKLQGDNMRTEEDRLNSPAAMSGLIAMPPEHTKNIWPARAWYFYRISVKYFSRFFFFTNYLFLRRVLQMDTVLGFFTMSDPQYREVLNTLLRSDVIQKCHNCSIPLQETITGCHTINPKGNSSKVCECSDCFYEDDKDIDMGLVQKLDQAKFSIKKIM